MARVFVSLGSNIDRESNIARARARLRENYGPLTESALYQSPALGFDGDDFYNMVVAFDTPDSPQRINAALRAIEDELLRVRGKDRFVSRTIDLDVLLYGDLVLADGALSLPRPEILDHEFVLGPLAEICGDLAHPVSGTPIARLWARWRAERPSAMQRVSEAQAAPAVDGHDLAGEVGRVPDQE